MGSGHLPAARTLAPRRRAVRLPARGRLRSPQDAGLPLAPRGQQRLRDAYGDPLDDVDHRRGHPLPAAVPDRLLRGRAAESRGDQVVPRPVRGHGPRLLRPDRVLSAVRQLPLHGRPRRLDGQADAGLACGDPRRGRERGRRAASAGRSAYAPAQTRTTRSAIGAWRRRARRRSAASGFTQRTPPGWTPTVTSGTRAGPTT